MDTIDIINSIGVLGALIFSLYNFWFNRYRKCDLKYIFNQCYASSRSVEKHGAKTWAPCFLVNIAIRNEGAQSIRVVDILLKVKDSEEKTIHFSPHVIFDLEYYANNKDETNATLKAEQGKVPLPIFVEGNSTYKFINYVQFLPCQDLDKLDFGKTPLEIDFLVKDETRNYEKVAQRTFYKDFEKVFENSLYSIASYIPMESRANYLKGKTNS